MRRNFAHDVEQCRLSMDALARAVSSYSFKPGVDVFPRGSVDEHSLVVLRSCIRLEGSWKHSFQKVSGDFHEKPEAYRHRVHDATYGLLPHVPLLGA
ncbi:hypothetical protein MRX96_032561 [Rhipicephalus microplus]